jgi:hypothetical protein
MLYAEDVMEIVVEVCLSVCDLVLERLFFSRSDASCDSRNVLNLEAKNQLVREWRVGTYGL